MTDAELQRRTMRKVMWRLPPLMALMFLINQLDRVNVSFAALTMNRDLGLTALDYAWGAGIFFIAYFAFEIPSNLILERVGARRWIARIMITWGLVSGMMAMVVGQNSFLAVRFLLGAAEAGFVPGLVLYITYWFPPQYRARATAVFFFAAPMGNAVAGMLSVPLLALNGTLGLTGWQWMFVVEAIPAVLLGFYILRNLPDRPRDAKWLTGEERDWLERQVARGHAGQTGDAGFGRTVVGLAAIALQAGDRAVVHDAAVALLAHDDRRRLDGCEVALEVDADDIVPLFLAQVEDHSVAQDGGEVDETVDLAVGVERGLDDAFAAGHRRDIGQVGDRFTAHLLDLFDHLLGGSCVSAGAVRVHAGVIDDDAGAFGRGEQRALAADAAAGAGHRDDFAFEQICQVKSSF